MSGGLFLPRDEKDDESHRNPLLCYLCKEMLKEPCLLQCYHTFCSQCLKDRAPESKLSCPLCGKTSRLKDGASLPPRDPLLSFLVESSAEEWSACANCDKLVSEQDSGAMFYCNTCSQALCGACREDTHRARMFSKHDVIHMSKRTKEIYKICDAHKEPYIMFSTLQKSMLCINCFRDMSIEGRAHCIDLDTAYNHGCKKFESTLLSVRDLQHSVRDGIDLFRAILEELSRNTESEKESIRKLCQSLQDTVISTRNSLLDDIQRQYDAKEKLFRGQLVSLGNLLPTIQIHLIMCVTFSSSANKHEFLHLGYMIMERLCTIAHMTSPLRPTQNSHVKTNFRAELSRNLDPILSEKPARVSAVEGNNSNDGCVSSAQPENCSVKATSLPPPTGNHATNTYARRFTAKNKLGSEVSGHFADHCKCFDTDYKELTARFAKLKDRAQEMQRDITLRKCLARKGKMADIKNDCSKLQTDIKQKLDALDNFKNVFEKQWEEQLQRIATEQELYGVQIHDLLNLSCENERVSSAIRQMEPFIKSITAMVEKISPPLSVSLNKEGRDDCIHALLEQINTIQPDSQQRVDAILSQEEHKQNKVTGLSPFEECLIQTKGMLKTPMKDGFPIRKDVDGTPIKDDASALVVGRVMEKSTDGEKVIDQNPKKDDHSDTKANKKCQNTNDKKGAHKKKKK